jgi:hypothetical protein
VVGLSNMKPKLPERLRDDYRMPNFLVGDLVRDDLTEKNVKVLEIIPCGYIIDSEYLEGYRYAYEVELPFGVWDEE